MSDVRAAVRDILSQLITAPDSELPALARTHLTPDTIWDVAFPIDRLVGADAVLEGLIMPLRQALTPLHRRDEIFIGGRNRLAPEDWFASITHYVGNFRKPLFGIAPSNRLVFLRSGELYRVEDGRIAEAKLIIDLLDLMRQIGRLPLPGLLGTEMLFPGPATHDGVLPVNREQGEVTLDLVEAMLADLHVFDPETSASKSQTGEDGYWHDHMLWYGPGGIGANHTWDGFVKDHRAPFLRAFPDRRGGDHYCHIGDGAFAAVSGWPSMIMTHTGDYLGIEATGRKLTLRVMDFYRCANGKIMENWVLLDYLDMIDQMGVDLLARAGCMADS